MRYILLFLATLILSCTHRYNIVSDPIYDAYYSLDEYTVAPTDDVYVEPLTTIYDDSYYQTNAYIIRYYYPYLIYRPYWNPCGHNYHSYYYNGMCSYYNGWYNGYGNYNIYSGWYGYNGYYGNIYGNGYGYNGCYNWYNNNGGHPHGLVYTHRGQNRFYQSRKSIMVSNRSRMVDSSPNRVIRNVENTNPSKVVIEGRTFYRTTSNKPDVNRSTYRVPETKPVRVNNVNIYSTPNRTKPASTQPAQPNRFVSPQGRSVRPVQNTAPSRVVRPTVNPSRSAQPSRSQPRTPSRSQSPKPR